MKKWLIAVVVYLAMFGVLSGQPWQNPDFTSNLHPWWVIYEYEAGTGAIIDPGSVDHSTYLGGSAHLTVDGSPSVIGIMNFTEQAIYAGDTIKMEVEHTDLANFGGISLRLGGGPDGDVVFCPNPAGLYTVELISSKYWQSGSPVWVPFVVWPGYAEAWIDWIFLFPVSVDEIEKKREDFTAPKWGITPNITNEREVNVSLVLPEASPVSLKVYDLCGRLVEILVKRTLSKGTHNFLWNSKNLDKDSNPSGQYFIQLETETPKFAETKKIIFVR